MSESVYIFFGLLVFLAFSFGCIIALALVLGNRNEQAAKAALDMVGKVSAGMHRLLSAILGKRNGEEG